VSQDDLAKLQRYFNEIPVSRLLGVRCEALQPGESRASMIADPALCNQNGAVPGVTLSSFADLVGGMAVATVSRPDEYFATLQLSLQFARAAFGSTFVGRSNVLRRASRHTFVRIDILDAEERLCVAASGTWVMFPGSAHALRDGADA
jgi:uncharacterized protein (TIGR00369 family)